MCVKLHYSVSFSDAQRRSVPNNFEKNELVMHLFFSQDKRGSHGFKAGSDFNNKKKSEDIAIINTPSYLCDSDIFCIVFVFAFVKQNGLIACTYLF